VALALWDRTILKSCGPLSTKSRMSESVEGKQKPTNKLVHFGLGATALALRPLSLLRELGVELGKHGFLHATYSLGFMLWAGSKFRSSMGHSLWSCCSAGRPQQHSQSPPHCQWRPA